jgi:hypothetical protein
MPAARAGSRKIGYRNSSTPERKLGGNIEKPFETRSGILEDSTSARASQRQWAQVPLVQDTHRSVDQSSNTGRTTVCLHRT